MPARVLEYNQIADLVNPIVREELGEEASILNENLDNVVDVGIAAENAGAVDRILDKLVARITRTIFYDKAYKRKDIYGFLKDNIEYGTLQRISNDYLLECEENASFELQEGMSPDPWLIKNLPQPSASYFEQKLTCEIDFSELRQQYKLVFKDASNLARFTAMCFTTVENSKNIQIEKLQKRLFNATMARNIAAHKEVDLIALYNTEMNLTGANRMTIAKAKYSKEFLRFASMVINDYYMAIKEPSTLYNLKEAPAWTTEPQVAMLSKFSDLCAYYSEADTFHDQLIKLPDGAFRKISAWQNQPSRDFTKISQIDVTIENTRVQQSNIVGAIYDKDGMMICLEELTTEGIYNPKVQVYNWFNKFITMMTTFDNCNMIVFVMNDPT